MPAPRRSAAPDGPWADLAAALAARRRELGLTQREAADLSDLSEKALRDIESGATAPRLDTLVALVASLGLDLALTNRSAERPSTSGVLLAIRRRDP